MVILICSITFIFTILGGFVALRFKSKSDLILGFSAGAVIGVAFFDLLPTALSLSAAAYGTRTIASLAGFGFIFYLLFNQSVKPLHRHRKNSYDADALKGKVAAFSLTFHSLMDGLAIGIAFQVSAGIGGIVAAAVLIHDFADGINTTNLIIKNNGTRKSAVFWLLINAAAPLLGALSTFFFTIPEKVLGILLAVISGFFLYIGASDLLPQSQLHSKFSTTLMTVLGIMVIYIAVHLSGIL